MAPAWRHVLDSQVVHNGVDTDLWLRRPRRPAGDLVGPAGAREGTPRGRRSPRAAPASPSTWPARCSTGPTSPSTCSRCSAAAPATWATSASARCVTWSPTPASCWSPRPGTSPSAWSPPRPWPAAPRWRPTTAARCARSSPPDVGALASAGDVDALAAAIDVAVDVDRARGPRPRRALLLGRGDARRLRAPLRPASVAATWSRERPRRRTSATTCTTPGRGTGTGAAPWPSAWSTAGSRSPGSPRAAPARRPSARGCRLDPRRRARPRARRRRDRPRPAALGAARARRPESSYGAAVGLARRGAARAARVRRVAGGRAARPAARRRVVSVLLPGRRDDPAHALGLGVSEEVVAFWPPAARDVDRLPGRPVERAARARRRARAGAGRPVPLDDPAPPRPTAAPPRRPGRHRRRCRAAGAGRGARRWRRPDGWSLEVLGGGGGWVDDPFAALRAADVVLTHAGQNARGRGRRGAGAGGRRARRTDRSTSSGDHRCACSRVTRGRRWSSTTGASPTTDVGRRRGARLGPRRRAVVRLGRRRGGRAVRRRGRGRPAPRTRGPDEHRTGERAGVAVVTIAHGRHAHLRRQHDSLLRQTRAPDHWVVVAMDDPDLAAVVGDLSCGAGAVELVEVAAEALGLPLAARPQRRRGPRPRAGRRGAGLPRRRLPGRPGARRGLRRGGRRASPDACGAVR